MTRTSRYTLLQTHNIVTITGFLVYVRRLVFWKEYNVSETGSVPSWGEKMENTYWVGPLKKELASVTVQSQSVN
jgi:hypothetical protein